MKNKLVVVLGVVSVLDVASFFAWLTMLVPFSQALLAILGGAFSITSLLFVSVYFLYPALLTLCLWCAWRARVMHPLRSLMWAVVPLAVVSILLVVPV